MNAHGYSYIEVFYLPLKEGFGFEPEFRIMGGSGNGLFIFQKVQLSQLGINFDGQTVGALFTLGEQQKPLSFEVKKIIGNTLIAKLQKES